MQSPKPLPKTEIANLDADAQLAPVSQPSLSYETLALIHQLAPAWHTSRWFGVSSPEQATILMAKAADLGLPITSAFDLIHMIPTQQGMNLALSPRGAQALILASGLLDGMKITEQPGSCTVWMKRRGGLEYELTYTLDDARRAELTEGSPLGNGRARGKGAWERWQANMLRWRALGFVQDVLFPDVTGGLKSAAQYGSVALSASGDIIDVAALEQEDQEADDA